MFDSNDNTRQARLVATGFLPLPQFYTACVKRGLSPLEAERLVIEAKAQLEVERQRLLGNQGPRLTAGRWIAESVGEHAVLVKPQPRGVRIGAIEI